MDSVDLASYIYIYIFFCMYVYIYIYIGGEPRIWPGVLFLEWGLGQSSFSILPSQDCEGQG